MIARIWRGHTPAEKSDAYSEYLERTGLADYRATPGNRGVFVFRDIHGQTAEFLILTLWDSWEAIRAFAGPDPEKARYYPEDDQYLLGREPHVRHYEVLR